MGGECHDDNADAAPTKVGDSVRDFVEALGPMMKELVEACLPVAADVARFPEHLKASLLVMAEHGWFLVSSMPPSCAFEVAEALNENRIDRAAALMCGYAEDDLEYVLAGLRRAFPDRAVIVEKAFQAHIAQDYELSVPVLLAQADGMAKERLQAGLYAKKRANKKADAEAELRARVDAALARLDWSKEWVYSAFVDPLRHLWPLSAPSSDLPVGETVLNRHAILHGESTGYAEWKISCQAMCLISYVALALDVLSEGESEAEARAHVNPTGGPGASDKHL